MRETKRDHELLEWLGELRIADVDAVRWALAGFAGRDEPVSGRRAQAWIARCRDAGLIETGRPTFQDGSVLWVAHHITGRAAPNLHRQTTRHEVAVAATSARFLAHGWSWRRDRRPVQPKIDHQADGVAVRGDEVALVEVELTAKTDIRYRHIFGNHLHRQRYEGITAVSYFCTPSAGAAIRRQIALRPDRYAFIHVVDVFDQRGRWTDAARDVWPTLAPVTLMPVEDDEAAPTTLWGTVNE